MFDFSKASYVTKEATKSESSFKEINQKLPALKTVTESLHGKLKPHKEYVLKKSQK